MAEVTPFQGIRYNTGTVKDLAAVVTPPYDVIDATAQQRYYEQHPCNVIRLEYGRQYPTDSDSDNRYTRAAADYRKWLQSGVLIREPKAALYLQEQSFQVDERWFHRTGFFARVGLEPYANGKIRPHEETLSKPKADRMALMEACRANFSPVFAYYEDNESQDAGQSLKGDFASIKTRPPQVDLVDDSGVRNRLWVINDVGVHQRVAAALKNRPLYIADGHHRYETALNFYHTVKDPGAASILMYLVPTSDPGLVVLPTHRILHSLPALNLPLFIERLQEDFAMEKIAPPTTAQAQQLLASRWQPDHPVMLMATPEPATYLLTLNNHLRVSQLVPDKSQAWCSLDVAVLHVLILDRLLGLHQEALAQQENLTYTRDGSEALQTVLTGQAQLSFMLSPTRIEQVTAVAAAGDKMPQKSTYFYPKLLTGLVINDLT